MAYVTQPHTNVFAGVWHGITNFFAFLGRSIAVSSAMEVRMERINKLNRKTDEELAAMNLRRADITAYVFRDLMHL